MARCYCGGEVEGVHQRHRIAKTMKKMPKTQRLRLKTALPPVNRPLGHGRRESLPLSSRLHPTRVVARAGMVWHTSAHKRNPLFRRRGPAPDTLDPPGPPPVPRPQPPSDPLTPPPPSPHPP